MRPAIFDLTGGERARAIRIRPNAPLPILDPTDPRYGALVPAGEQRATDARPSAASTDQESGE